MSVSAVVLIRTKQVTIPSVVAALGSILISVALTGCGSTSQNSAASGVVGTATDPTCVVPSLRGEGLRDARRALRQAHCKLGKFSLLGEPSALYKEDSSYIVTEQSVGAGTALPVNSAVTVRLGPAPAGLVSYRVPSGSMEPSLPVGTTVWVQTHGYSPTVGDVVVLYPPEGAQREECGPVPHTVKLGGAACAEPVPMQASVKLLKRVVAGLGDEIYIKEGRVYRRAAGESTFVREQDSYIKSCGSSPECNFPTPIKIPPGHWFMMGDNRGESDDSRFWGSVPTSWIIGPVVYCAAVGKRCPKPGFPN